MKLLLFGLLLVVSSFSANAQGITYVTLKNEKATYAPVQIYVSDVVDDRSDKYSVGTINQGGGKTDKLVMKNEVAASLKTYITANISQDRTKQPVVIHIQDLPIEIKKSGAVWEVKATVVIAFHVAGKQTMEYTGRAQGKVTQDPAGYVEKFIRKCIDGDIKKFDEWWQQNKGKVATNSSVKVNVTISKATDKPNLIVYSRQRQLQIGDFTGPPQGQELELAETLSGIAVRYTGETENSQTILNITITPYFDRSRSWIKEKGKNSRVLAHEQAHFDITAVKACELAQILRTTVFTESNYEKLISELQKKNAEQANAEEDRYDAETDHGIIEDKQRMWEQKLKEQVKTMGCY